MATPQEVRNKIADIIVAVVRNEYEFTVGDNDALLKQQLQELEQKLRLVLEKAFPDSGEKEAMPQAMIDDIQDFINTIREDAERVQADAGDSLSASSASSDGFGAYGDDEADDDFAAQQEALDVKYTVSSVLTELNKVPEFSSKHLAELAVIEIDEEDVDSAVAAVKDNFGKAVSEHKKRASRASQAGMFGQVEHQPPLTDKVKVLWMTDSTQNGRGDYEYMRLLSNLDFLQKELGLGRDNVEHLRLVFVSSTNDTLVDVPKTADAVTKKDVKISEENDKVKIVLYGDRIEAAMRHGRSEGDFIKIAKDSVSRDVNFTNADFIICVSANSCVGAAQVLRGVNPKAEPKVLFIGGHGAVPLKDNQNVQEVNIGLQNGFLMVDVVSPVVAGDRVKMLASIADDEYKKSLLGGKSEADFLASTLLAPAYLQHEEAAKGFVLGVLQSDAVDKFNDGATFHLSLHKDARKPGTTFSSPSDILEKLFDADMCKTLKAKGYTHIEVDGFARMDSVSKILDDSGKAKKTVRIMANQWMKNQSDFNALFGAAQVVAGASGDNSLNNALGKGVIPFYATQPWNQDFKVNFLKDLKEFLPDCKQIDPKHHKAIIDFFDNVMPVMGQSSSQLDEKAVNDSAKLIADNFSSALNDASKSGVLDSIKIVIDEIQKNKNFSDTMRHEVIEPINAVLQQKTQRRQLDLR